MRPPPSTSTTKSSRQLNSAAAATNWSFSYANISHRQSCCGGKSFSCEREQSGKSGRKRHSYDQNINIEAATPSWEVRKIGVKCIKKTR